MDLDSFLTLFAPYMKKISMLTVGVSVVGSIQSMRLYKFFMRSSDKIAVHNRFLFMAWALVFISTLLFSFGTMMNYETDKFAFFYILRIVAFLVAILAAGGLYRTYKKIGRGEDDAE